MKILLDQNISYRLVKKVEHEFPGCQHVNRLGLMNKSDQEIWDYASKHDYTILTFDADFFDLATVNGFPPKVIWIKSGNLTTANIEQLLLSKRDQLFEFHKDPEIACLEIHDVK